MIAIVSAVISNHPTGLASGSTQGIVDAIRPTLLILIALGVAGVVVLLPTMRARQGGEIQAVATADVSS